MHFFEKHKKSYILSFILLAIFSFFSSCQEKNQELDKDAFVNLIDKDSVTLWLSNSNNYYDSTFIEVFTEHYTKNMEDSQFNKAAEILYGSFGAAVANFSNDTLLYNYSIDFIEKNELKIDKYLAAGINYNIGCFYSQQGNYESSEKYLSKVLNHGIFILNYKYCLIIAEAHREMLYNCLFNGELVDALNHGFNALSFDNITSYEIGKAYSYAGIAAVYANSMEIEKAIEYYNKAISLMNEQNAKEQCYIIYTNKVELLNGLNHPDLIYSIDTLLSLYQETNQQIELFYIDSQSWKAIKYVRTGDTIKAKEIIEELLTLSNVIISCEGALNKTILAIAEYEKTYGTILPDKTAYKKIIPKLETSGQYSLVMMYSYLLVENYKKHNDYENAYYYEKVYSRAKDSLSGIEIRKNLHDIESNFNQAKEAKEQVKKEQSLKRTIIYISAFFAIILTSLILNILLRLKHFKIDRERKKQFTKQIFEEIEFERKRIATDLHDTIGHDLLTLKNKDFLIQNNLNSDVECIIDSVRNISRNLHPAFFEVIGLVASLKQMILRISENATILINTKFNYNNCLNKEDEIQIYRIIQEAITNIIKHSNADAAKIIVVETKKHVFVEILDSGSGFNLKECMHSKKAFGLHSIIERARIINGKTLINSSNKGTRIKIKINKNENGNNSR